MRCLHYALLGLALLTIALVTGCGEGNDSSRSQSQPPSPTQKPVSVDVVNPDRCDFLDQSRCLLPFPSDYFTIADPREKTNRRLSLKKASMPANKDGVHISPSDYNRSDGFSTGQPIVLRVPGLNNAKAFENSKLFNVTNIKAYKNPDAAAIILDTDTGERWPIWAELEQSREPMGNPLDPDFGGAPPPEQTALYIRPARTFAEGHHYIVALRDLKTAQGKTIEPSPVFKAYRDGRPTNSDAVEKRRPHMEELLQTLSDAGISRDNLYLAWDFTVASRDNIAGRLFAIRDDAFSRLGDHNLSDQTVAGVHRNTPSMYLKIARMRAATRV